MDEESGGAPEGGGGGSDVLNKSTAQEVKEAVEIQAQADALQVMAGAVLSEDEARRQSIAALVGALNALEAQIQEMRDVLTAQLGVVWPK